MHPLFSPLAHSVQKEHSSQLLQLHETLDFLKKLKNIILKCLDFITPRHKHIKQKLPSALVNKLNYIKF